jgi:hypothetical protein
MEKVKMEESKAADGKLEAQVKSADMVGCSAIEGCADSGQNDDMQAEAIEVGTW